MTTVIAIFLLSLAFSLILTPLGRRFAKKCCLMDQPSERKVHNQAIPRTGGIAIYLAFFISLLLTWVYSNLSWVYPTSVLDLLVLDQRIIFLILGASLAFALGLWDDVRRLRYGVKFAVQLLAALIAYAGGIQITGVALPWNGGLSLGWLSLPLTVFWFLLVINAINLIDGLDGLAAGVSFFVSMVLLVLCATGEKFLVAIGLAALGGASLGFLRYNFNPASIFMGDSGSYFLGYMLAGLSVMGSIKSQATVTILIPIIALGFPLMDTMIAPIRRFVFGNGLFQPDRDHVHHRLLRLGFTQRRAVMILYGITVCMGTLSLLLVHARDDLAALILLIVGAAVILGIRKLGYLEHLAAGKLIGWFRDVTDDLGLKRDRRVFLACQVAISQSSSLEEMWDKTVSAARFLGLDYVELDIFGRYGKFPNSQPFLWEFIDGDLDSNALDSNRSLHLSLPLANKGHQLGFLILAKDLLVSPLTPSTLRRIEDLRRTVLETLPQLLNHDLSHTPKLSESCNLKSRSSVLLFPQELRPQKSKLPLH